MCRARAERSRPRTAAPGRPLALVATLRQAVLHPLPLQVHLTTTIPMPIVEAHIL